MNVHRSVAVLIKFLQLHQIFLVTMDTARPRFSGSTERLADALEMPTPWSLQFPLRDPAIGKEPQLQPHLLLKHTQMLRLLNELQPNHASKQTQLREAIAVLTKSHPHGKFNERPDDF